VKLYEFKRDKEGELMTGIQKELKRQKNSC